MPYRYTLDIKNKDYIAQQNYINNKYKNSLDAMAYLKESIKLEKNFCKKRPVMTDSFRRTTSERTTPESTTSSNNTSSTYTPSRTFGSVTHQAKQGEYLFKNTKLTDTDRNALKVANDALNKELAKLNDQNTDKMSDDAKINLGVQKSNLKKLQNAIAFLSNNHSVGDGNVGDFERQLTEAKKVINELDTTNMSSDLNKLFNNDKVKAALEKLKSDNAFKTNNKDITIDKLKQIHTNKEDQKTKEKEKKDGLWKKIKKGDFKTVEEFDKAVENFKKDNGNLIYTGEPILAEHLAEKRNEIELKEAKEKAEKYSFDYDEKIRGSKLIKVTKSYNELSNVLDGTPASAIAFFKLPVSVKGQQASIKSIVGRLCEGDNDEETCKRMYDAGLRLLELKGVKDHNLPEFNQKNDWEGNLSRQLINMKHALVKHKVIKS